MLSLVADRGHLLTLVDGFPDEEFLPESDDRFPRLPGCPDHLYQGWRRDRPVDFSGKRMAARGKHRESVRSSIP